MTLPLSSPDLAALRSRNTFAEMAEPLEFILKAHQDQRVFQAGLERLISATQPNVEDARLVLTFIRHRLVDHIADEREGLFPLMRKRCLTEDDIEASLSKVEAHHRESARLHEEVITLLVRALEVPEQFSEPEADLLKSFLSHEQRHLIVTNAIVLPLAELRLEESDKCCLRKNLAARRGLDIEEEGLMHSEPAQRDLKLSGEAK